MLFKYQFNVKKDCPALFVDMRTINTESDWQAMRDVIGAFKLSLDCNCHVELEPIKTTLSNLRKLAENKPVFKIDIQIETWKARATAFQSLTEIP